MVNYWLKNQVVVSPWIVLCFRCRILDTLNRGVQKEFLNHFAVSELKVFLRNAGQRVGGNKATLVDRGWDEDFLIGLRS